MSAPHERADQVRRAVRLALASHGVMTDRDTVSLAALQDAFVTVGAVLAEEFGPRPEDAAPPPVHELPTEPGAVVFVTEMHGSPLATPRAAVLVPDAHDDEIPWRVGTPGAGAYSWLTPRDITGWLPALVVRDDERGPRAALEAILKVAQDSDVDNDVARDLMADDAREALARLDGGGTP
jgi:hypothetical protein